MPTYVFEHKRSGHQIERAFTMTKCPDKLRYKGRTYRKIISFDGMDTRLAIKPTVHNLVSRSLPLNWKFAKKHDKMGQPVFASRHEISECVARANDHGEGVTYDD